jgi:homocysteine S-methyltransferase
VEINGAGARIAREAAREAGGDRILVAGSIGPLGLKIEPWGPTSVEEAEEAFREQAQALQDGGVDVFILETFSDINEIHQAIRAVQSLSGDTALVAQMTIGDDGNSLYGTTPEVFTTKLEEWGAHVIGVNCSVGPAHMHECIEKMAEVTELPLSAMPNAGVPKEVDGRNIYLCSPEYMAEYAKRFIVSGVKIIGGCCGTRPAHIKAMGGAIRALQPSHRTPVHVSAPAEGKVAVETVQRRDKSELARKLADDEFVVSVEVVPPRGHDPSRSIEIARMLKSEGVDCINIPDGPRASARMSAMALACILRSEAAIEPILHYTCRDRNLLGMQSDLLGMHAQGIRNVLIVTGDPPKLGDYPDATAVFDVDSIGLTNVVALLNRGIDIGGKKMSAPAAFHIGVGANPGAVRPDHEVSRFEWKVDAGAEFAITQPVFDADLLMRFLDRIAHCRIPILAGIWPLYSLRNAEFMDNEVPGASVPPQIMERMRKAQDLSPEQARAEGVAIAREAVEAIKHLVQGIQISPPLGKYALALEVLKVL